MSKARQLADLGNVYDDGALSNRNLIINGNLSVAQRNGTSSVTHTSGALTYNADRWFVFADGASVTGQIVTGTNTGTHRAYKITGASGVTSLNFAQRIESLNVKHLDGKKVTVSFKMYASQSLSGVSATLFFCSADDTGYGTSNVSNSLTVNSGLNTYEETFTLPSVASRGFELAIAFGSNLPSGATVEIAQVQLEVGDTATPFEHRSYGDELARCMRYYQKPSGRQIQGVMETTTIAQAQIPFLTAMRAAPTLTRLANSTWGSAGGDLTNTASYNFSGTGKQGAVIALSFTSSSSIGIPVTCATDAILDLDAEL
jgi:hypothetical protein